MSLNNFETNGWPDWSSARPSIVGWGMPIPEGTKVVFPRVLGSPASTLSKPHARSHPDGQSI